ncbi:hypothetical protein [Nostoc sp.]|uniref:hypothetical protein n=1 Tax=Nostoc sp. TaxID=1180 RepID=UPI002FFC1B7D
MLPNSTPGRTHLNIDKVVRKNGHSSTCELNKGVRGDRGLSGGKKLDLDGKVIVKVESSPKKA